MALDNFLPEQNPSLLGPLKKGIPVKCSLKFVGFFAKVSKTKKQKKALLCFFWKSEFIMNWWKKSVENRTVQVMCVCVFC